MRDGLCLGAYTFVVLGTSNVLLTPSYNGTAARRREAAQANAGGRFRAVLTRRRRCRRRRQRSSRQPRRAARTARCYRARVPRAADARLSSPLLLGCALGLGGDRIGSDLVERGACGRSRDVARVLRRAQLERLEELLVVIKLNGLALGARVLIRYRRWRLMFSESRRPRLLPCEYRWDSQL